MEDIWEKEFRPRLSFVCEFDYMFIANVEKNKIPSFEKENKMYGNFQTHLHF
jgi:hypothetical protein